MAGARYPTGAIEINRKQVSPGTEFRYYNYKQVDKSAKNISEKLESEGIDG